jgi:hypothetical protein
MEYLYQPFDDDLHQCSKRCPMHPEHLSWGWGETLAGYPIRHAYRVLFDRFNPNLLWWRGDAMASVLCDFVMKPHVRVGCVLDVDVEKGSTDLHEETWFSSLISSPIFPNPLSHTHRQLWRNTYFHRLLDLDRYDTMVVAERAALKAQAQQAAGVMGA